MRNNTGNEFDEVVSFKQNNFQSPDTNDIEFYNAETVKVATRKSSRVTTCLNASDLLRSKAPPTCSKCKVRGHTVNRCSTDINSTINSHTIVDSTIKLPTKIKGNTEIRKLCKQVRPIRGIPLASRAVFYNLQMI
jgi:hypothetical protein